MEPTTIMSDFHKFYCFLSGIRRWQTGSLGWVYGNQKISGLPWTGQALSKLSSFELKNAHQHSRAGKCGVRIRNRAFRILHALHTSAENMNKIRVWSRALQSHWVQSRRRTAYLEVKSSLYRLAFKHKEGIVNIHVYTVHKTVKTLIATDS